jgi:hypothetical protein
MEISPKIKKTKEIRIRATIKMMNKKNNLNNLK